MSLIHNNIVTGKDTHVQVGGVAGPSVEGGANSVGDASGGGGIGTPQWKGGRRCTTCPKVLNGEAGKGGDVFEQCSPSGGTDRLWY